MSKQCQSGSRYLSASTRFRYEMEIGRWTFLQDLSTYTFRVQFDRSAYTYFSRGAAHYFALSVSASPTH
jgi:hypothetical protein